MAYNEQYANNLVSDNLYKNINALDYKSCWLWEGARNAEGYGMTARNVNKKKYGIMVHRLSWYLLYGNIPDGVVLDHTCHNPAECQSGSDCTHRRCFNPYHLNPTSTTENIRRGANNRDNVGMCRNNLHEWIPENIATWGSGRKACLPCHRATTKRNTKKVGI